jgi:hypothetical protein
MYIYKGKYFWEIVERVLLILVTIGFIAYAISLMLPEQESFQDRRIECTTKRK